MSASLWAGAVESELLHTYSKVDALDVLILCVRLAVLVAVTLTVPVVLFPVRHLSTKKKPNICYDLLSTQTKFNELYIITKVDSEKIKKTKRHKRGDLNNNTELKPQLINYLTHQLNV